MGRAHQPEGGWVRSGSSTHAWAGQEVCAGPIPLQRMSESMYVWWRKGMDRQMAVLAVG
jgi:hypothetical protein